VHFGRDHGALGWK